jgi:hypothetical protein
MTHADVIVGDDPDDIVLDIRDGHLFIAIGTAVTLCLDEAGKDVIERLALVTAEASLVKRSRELWEVA